MDVYVVHDLKNVEDYFYAETKLGRENDVYVYLSKRYHNRCLSCDLIAKEDLDLFRDIADVMKARKELQPIVKRNIELKLSSENDKHSLLHRFSSSNNSFRDRTPSTRI
ncbi:unnamed protein product [Rotaria socialis]|uniref:Uncharacterized protein n=1 Tax=Rotaria socialis TaxID=392032 RepID=A0A820BXX9_9BILA|nr:unnamed protein product [Rotaria socialis]CAF4432347.1 unnamed protein product [Rotaria socialis]CAF4623825.1 unnamed protein product [Rotaria socialis]CAF4715750.1 unnamed protein product [Rotaria socialis]